MTGIIDYGLGNLFSLEKALKRNHSPYLISSDPNQLKTCDRLILGGVGHFGYGMQHLNTSGISELIHEQVNCGKHLLGICLGMQLLGEHSDEGDAAGLNLLPARIKMLKVSRPFKIPHVGWNTVSGNEKNPLFKGCDPGAKFYFTHSYGISDQEPFVTGKTTYGDCRFAAAIGAENVHGVQFHPEKSFEQGLQLLKNFCAL